MDEGRLKMVSEDSNVPQDYEGALAYAERLEARHLEDMERLQRALVVATLPVEWLNLVKSCVCVPCIALVRGWAKSQPVALGDGQHAHGVDLRLSPKDRALLSGLVRGLSNREISLEVNQALSTVKNHLSRLFVILHAHSRIQAANRAIELGLVDRPA